MSYFDTLYKPCLLDSINIDPRFIIEVNTNLAGDTDNNKFTIRTDSIGDYNYNYSVEATGNLLNPAQNITGDYILEWDMPGTYDVFIHPNNNLLGFPVFRAQSPNTVIVPYDSQKITKIKSWGKGLWQSLARAFMGCFNLESVDVPYDINAVEDFRCLRSFQGCSKLTNLKLGFEGNLKIRDITTMFSASGGLAPHQDIFVDGIEKWDMSELLNGSAFLLHTRKLINYDECLIGWNLTLPNQTGAVTNFQFGTSKLLTPEGIAARTAIVNKGWTINDADGTFEP